MMKQASVVVLTLGIVGHVAASGRDQLARFDGGIGVVPVSNVAVNATTGAVTVTRNIVRGVNPPGQIWVIADLKADVDTNGRIKVRGRGLLLGGGSSIGQNANQSVLATLICEAAAPFTLHNTDAAGVPLEPNGDFEIDDTLDPSVSSDCASPVLLIRNTGGVWFAAGIPKPGHDDDQPTGLIKARVAAGARAAATRHHDWPDVSQLNESADRRYTPVLHHDSYARAAGNAGDRVRGEDSGCPICSLRIKRRLGRKQARSRAKS